MADLNRATTEGAPRRSLFGRLAGATALGLAGLVSTSLRRPSGAAEADGPDWPGVLMGRHRQVVDGYDVSGGRVLEFAHTFLATNPSPGAATAVVVLRAAAFPIALNSAMWAKYKIGESLKIIDAGTKAPATNNPFLQASHGSTLPDDAALDRLLAQGAIIGACNFSLLGQSRRAAGNAGVSADDAAKEWAANLVPGVAIIPSGTWGLNRAQEAGCTYCAGG